MSGTSPHGREADGVSHEVVFYEGHVDLAYGALVGGLWLLALVGLALVPYPDQADGPWSGAERIDVDVSALAIGDVLTVGDVTPPEGVRIETLPDELDPISEPDARRFIGGSLVTLLYMTQIAAISQDPWFSRVQSPLDADYVAIAISPALIMLLVGSLMYFLLLAGFDPFILLSAGSATAPLPVYEARKDGEDVLLKPAK